MSMELRLVPGARRRKIRVKKDVAHLLDPTIYRACAGTVRRIKPKRDQTMSARQWKKQRKEARRVDC